MVLEIVGVGAVWGYQTLLAKLERVVGSSSVCFARKALRE